jgi:hypothetical protein
LVTGVQFGVAYDTTVAVGSWTLCTGGLEIAEPGWPDSGTGFAATWPGIHHGVGSHGLHVVGFFQIEPGSTGQVRVTMDQRIDAALVVDEFLVPSTVEALGVCSIGADGSATDVCVGATPPAVAGRVFSTLEVADVVAVIQVDSVWTYEDVLPNGSEMIRTGVSATCEEVIVGDPPPGWCDTLLVNSGCVEDALGATRCRVTTAFHPGGFQLVAGDLAVATFQLLGPDYCWVPRFSLTENLLLDEVGRLADVSGLPRTYHASFRPSPSPDRQLRPVGTMDQLHREVARYAFPPPSEQVARAAEAVVYGIVSEVRQNVALDTRGRPTTGERFAGRGAVRQFVLVASHLQGSIEGVEPESRVLVNCFGLSTPGVGPQEGPTIPDLLEGRQVACAVRQVQDHLWLVGGSAGLSYRYANGEYQPKLEK